ncbi:hypothetical protein [Actinoplanes sp. ATCC 53533]|uniref:hypothetical protein n=1 Tax=Actinoplanes sp. ATCC 53533 TaxID=1288362 RepID=UPI001F31A1C6|nr:hypothetical protein [Actinoplanes sp. ATCC 53533]
MVTPARRSAAVASAVGSNVVSATRARRTLEARISASVARRQVAGPGTVGQA